VGSRSLRVYFIHLETRIANRKHADQLTTVLKDANRYGDLPTIILGDFNTVYFRTEQTFALLKAADFKTRPYEGASFRKVLFLRKKLDWIWTRNLDILESGLQEKVEASDHRPLWAELQWSSQADAQLAVAKTNQDRSSFLSLTSPGTQSLVSQFIQGLSNHLCALTQPGVLLIGQRQREGLQYTLPAQ